ncbi:CBS domain-containing protein, partial [Streptomyces sp. WAC08241]|uniref:CBS domain-containing protein n=1 Tax=Streptomyces sp. WAC08241 TaxID=2487421 RepID=UPI000FA0CD0D
VLGAPATPYVADFVGSDRGLKRLAVTPVGEADLDPVPAGGPEEGDPAPVPLGTSLKEALAVLLQHDTGRLTVTDADGSPLGVLTPAGVHRALRRASAA